MAAQREPAFPNFVRGQVAIRSGKDLDRALLNLEGDILAGFPRQSGFYGGDTFFVDEPNRRVGIRTKTPAAPLHVLAGTNAPVRVERNSGAECYLEIANTTNTWRVGESSGEVFTVRDETAATEPFTIIKAAPTASLTVDGSGRVAVGTASPNAAAALEVSSTTRGLLLPRMTTTQRDAISSPPDGLLVYNTSLSKAQVRAGGAWVDLH